MKNKVVVAVLLLAGLAWAVSESVERVASARPSHYVKGIYIGEDSDRVVADTQNKLSQSCAGQINYVFPALPDDGGATGDACQMTWADTCEGATVGDPCMVGIGYGASGVPVLGQDDQFDCFVSASNTVKVRRCSTRGMGALVDAGYAYRTFSFR